MVTTLFPSFKFLFEFVDTNERGMSVFDVQLRILSDLCSLTVHPAECSRNRVGGLNGELY